MNKLLPVNSFLIGDHEVIAGGVPLFLPDIGTFFNKNLELAFTLVDELVTAGVTTIKGEILHDPEICLPESGDEIYWGHVTNSQRRENYRSLIERKTIRLADYERLFRYCSKRGLGIVVSVYDLEGARFAKAIGINALKIASSNITHKPLIEYVASLALPVIIDTGHSTLEEIARAVNWVHDVGERRIIVEHSPLAPPNPVQQHNLRFMNIMGAACGVPFGLSDHHNGDEMLYAAVALGASVIEKGVRPNNLGDEQDAAHAIPVSEVEAVLKKIKNIHSALGTGIRVLRRDRDKYRSRMGLVAKKDMSIGEVVSLESVTFAFPIRGIPVEHWSEVLGSAVVRPIAAGEVIYWRDLNAIPR